LFSRFPCCWGKGPFRAASAAPATATGPSALALAAVVAENSSLLSAHDRSVLARLFDGHLNFGFPANQKISVKADAVVCRASDIDITARSCELTFGTHKRSLKGRRANELNATAVEAGVPSEGAAGSNIALTSFAPLTPAKSSKRLAAAQTAHSIQGTDDNGVKVTPEKTASCLPVAQTQLLRESRKQP